MAVPLLQRLLRRETLQLDDVPMHASFAEIEGASVVEPAMAVPDVSLHDARTIGPEHPAFADERAARAARPTWQPLVATLPEAELRAPDPAVYHEGVLVYPSLWDIDQLRRSHHELERRGRGPVVRAGRAANILSLWCDNYYHWLADALPRLAVLAAAGVGDQIALVTPASPSAFQEGSLRALGVWERRLPLTAPRTVFETLVWPSGCDPIGFPSPRTTSWLRSAFRGAPAANDGGTRLYIRRALRTVANPREVTAVLDRFGFEPVEPERLSFTEQVATFARAEAIVGCHGAGMANSVFAQSGAQVVELFQPGYVNLSTYRLARAAGMRYGYLVGEAAGARRLGKNRDVLVDTRRLTAFLYDSLSAA